MDRLDTLVEKYTGLLVQLLKDEGLVEDVDPATQRIKFYNLTNKQTYATPVTDEPLNTGTVAENIASLNALAKDIYFNTQKLDNIDKEKVLPSDIFNALANAGALRLPNLSSGRLQAILDKGRILLDEEDVRSDAIELLDIQNKYPLYTRDLLEFYVGQIVSKQFPGYDIKSQYKGDGNEIDLEITSQDISEPNVLFEIMYRRKALNTIKDDIYSAYEKMARYNRLNKKDTCLVILIFTDEGSDVLEKIDYRFKQYQEELFPSYAKQIFLISLFIKNIHLLSREIEKVKFTISDTNSRIVEFNLHTQKPIIAGIYDDDVYIKIFDLSHYSYEITVTPVLRTPHWRVGVRFSQNDSFPYREGRHSKGYPLFHVEKNIQSESLSISYYDENNHQKIISQPTSLSQYQQDTFTFILSYDKGEARIDLVDRNRDSILKQPIMIASNHYFMLSAWADNRNKFDFKMQFKERKLAVPKGVIIPIKKADSNKVTIFVHDQNDEPVEKCRIVILGQNNTYFEGFTVGSGEVNLSIPKSDDYTILAAHQEFPSVIIERFTFDSDARITLIKHPKITSLIINRTGYIPGLEGRLNPILDASFRRYLYADNIAIDGGKQQPVHFDINEPMVLEDKNKVVKRIIFRFIRGTTSVLDILN